MGPCDPWAMFLMGNRTLGTGPIIDVYINWKFQDVSPGHRQLVADESLLSFNWYMTQDAVISESLDFWIIKNIPEGDINKQRFSNPHA